MAEENIELSLKLRCADETVWFTNPYPTPGSPLSFRPQCGAETATAYPSGRDIGSTCDGKKLQFAKGEISDMDAVSCRGRTEELADIIREEKPRKKLRLSQNQTSVLEESFREQSTLSPKHKYALASNLNVQPRQVEVWFQNRRARTKLKRKEVELENLKQRCEGLKEQNIILEREVQAMRAMKIVWVGGEENLNALSPNSMPLAAATLRRCLSCEGHATMNSGTTICTSQFKPILPRLTFQLP